MCIVQCLAPDLYEHPVVVLQNTGDSLLCLFVSRQQPRTARFEEAKGKAGFLENNAYYEYIRINSSEVGLIYNEFLQ